MRFRVGGLIEMVAAFAVALAVAKVVSSELDPGDVKDITPARLLWYRFHIFFEPMLAILALVGILGLWIEYARNRSPAVWGLGRWTWSLTALFHVLYILVVGLRNSSYAWRCSENWNWEDDLFISVTDSFPDLQVCVLISFLITARLAGLPRDPAPDAREWAGRGYALVLVTYLTFTLIILR